MTSKNKKPTTSTPKKEDSSGEKLKYVSETRQTEILEAFQLLKLPTLPTYPGADQFSRNIQRTGALQYDGILFSTTGSTLSPFKTGT